MRAALLTILLCMPQEEIRVGLTFKEAPRDRTVKHDKLTMDGTCALPDDFNLRVTVEWKIDFVSDSGELVPNRFGRGGNSYPSVIHDRMFYCAAPLMGPGLYDIIVDIPVALQREELLTDAQKKSLAAKNRWTFEYGAWDNDLPEKWADRLPALRILIADIRKHVRKLQEATSTEDHWNQVRESVLTQGVALSDRVAEHQSLSDSLPATVLYLQFIVKSLYKSSAKYEFHEGKLAGGGAWWDGQCDALDEALKIAGREYALWTVKLMRAAPDKDWPEIRASLAKTPASPELKPWLGRLKECTRADLDPLEKVLRAATVEVPK
jgi:hypothetical protein